MLRGVPRQRAEELNNWRKIARRHGGDYAFRTEALRSTEEERFIRAALDAEVEVEEVFDLADALLRGEWTFRSYADTRDGFVDAIRDLFVDGQSSEITRRKFSAQLRAYLRESGLVAYRDGMNASGYDPESFSQKEVAVFRAWQEQQSQYVTGLGAELFGPGVSEAVIEDRVRMWADISLREINLHGVAAGDAGNVIAGNTNPGRTIAKIALSSTDRCTRLRIGSMLACTPAAVAPSVRLSLWASAHGRRDAWRPAQRARARQSFRLRRL